jgi:hypothetical protein
MYSDGVEDQRVSEAIVAITAAIILAPRLKALELRDSVPMRNLIQEAVSLAKLVLRKTEVELARDLAKTDSGPASAEEVENMATITSPQPPSNVKLDSGDTELLIQNILPDCVELCARVAEQRGANDVAMAITPP